MSCVKDSLYMANSVNNGQNALDGMVGSKLELYAQENCHLLHSLSNTESLYANSAKPGQNALDGMVRS